jgi:hypothetical protein
MSRCVIHLHRGEAHTAAARRGREALRAVDMERADRVDLFRDLLGDASAATAHPNGASRS